MTEEELDRIESTLDVKLPPDYKASLLDFPSGGRVSDVTSFLGDASVLIELNLDLRAGKNVVTPWPAQYFALGHDGGGSCDAIDLADPDHRVYWINMKDISRFREHDPHGQKLTDWLRIHRGELEDALCELDASLVDGLRGYAIIGLLVAIVLVLIAILAR